MVQNNIFQRKKKEGEKYDQGPLNAQGFGSVSPNSRGAKCELMVGKKSAITMFLEETVIIDKLRFENFPKRSYDSLNSENEVF